VEGKICADLPFLPLNGHTPSFPVRAGLDLTVQLVRKSESAKGGNAHGNGLFSSAAACQQPHDPVISLGYCAAPVMAAGVDVVAVFSASGDFDEKPEQVTTFREREHFSSRKDRWFAITRRDASQFLLQSCLSYLRQPSTVLFWHARRKSSLSLLSRSTHPPAPARPVARSPRHRGAVANARNSFLLMRWRPVTARLRLQQATLEQRRTKTICR